MMKSQNNGLQNDGFHPLDQELINEYNSIRLSPNKEYICYAPFTSLLFNVHGEAYACCENPSYKYAVYPKESIHDIWFGKRVEILREHIKRNDLNLGCAACKNNLEIKNFGGVKARFYDYTRNTGKYPVRMEFQLSNFCNLECIMCDGWSSSLLLKKKCRLPQFTNPYDDDFVNQLEEFIPHLEQAFFVGGEPFMIELYYKIWEKIVESNPSCMISVQTNGTILNQKVKALLEKGNFEINLSIDSVRKEKYEKIRKNAVFERTMQNIDYFVEYCKRKNTIFQFTTCPMQNNWKEIPELIGFANHKDVRMLFHTVLYPRRFTLFGFSQFRLKRINQYLGKELHKLPGEIYNERFNKESIQMLMYQISHFYNDKTRKKEWSTYEKELNRYNTREHLLKLKKKEIKDTEKRRRKELVKRFTEEKMQLKQSKKIGIKKVKYELYHAEDKNYLIRYFRREAGKYCFKRYFYQPVKMVTLLNTVNTKLDELFTLHTKPELAEDMVLTVFSNLSLFSIIKSLEKDSLDQLFEGYLAMKKKGNDKK